MKFRAYGIISSEGFLVVNEKNIPYLVPCTEDGKIEIERFYEDMAKEHLEWSRFHVGIIEEL